MEKVILAILDGVGYREDSRGNAFKLANTPNIDKLLSSYPYGYLKASGGAVGLPEGQMGNSEVGHLTIGSGRVVLMPLERINQEIVNKTFRKNDGFLQAIKHAKDNKAKLHIMGMLSDGGVHSHIDHIFELMAMAKEQDVKELYLHLFLDGRDTLPNVALTYLNKLDAYMKKLEIGKIATIQGRYYGMDREGMWSVTNKAYDAIVRGIGKKANDYKEMVNSCYNEGIYDEFIPPYVFDKDGMISSNDAIIVANFRPDRLTQLLWAITDNSFPHFKIDKLSNILMITMMKVDERVKCINAFNHENVVNTLGEVLENSGCRSLRIAEVSKYPHVTHFFDGDKDVSYLNTRGVKIPRKEVFTYDLYPAMSAYEVTDKIIEVMDNYDFILVNYANGDMIGHTGNLEAAIKAMEVIDECIGNLYNYAWQNNYTLIVTADHGNVEEMLDKDGNVLTAHSLNKVYFLVCNDNYKVNNGGLCDVAPTVLDIMGIKVPKEMTGKSLIDRI